VTPVVAVLKVLKKNDPQAEIRFWCDTKFFRHAEDIIRHFDSAIPVQSIYSGKLRRYHHLPLWKQLILPSIVLPNIRDMVYVVFGFFQSLVKLILWRPDVVFTKGGFVCLPVGLAAKLLRIPLVIHDSDAHPGLTNRVLARWASKIGTGAPLKYYPYPAAKTQYVGIPVAEECVPYTPAEQATMKKELDVDPAKPLIVVTGGGLGARRINDAVTGALSELLSFSSVILVSGSGQYDELVPLVPQNSQHFKLYPFVTPLVPMFGAADIVVTRAGATTLLELAAMAKPTVLIPNGYLTGGHQLKNAAVYSEKNAVQVIDEAQLETQPEILVKTLQQLVEQTSVRKELARQIHRFAKPQAARDMADMILAAAHRQ
jgi:UDP-N-acetylglucosamine--N-acetylmuramyl-(pentapeptide) pyrophosphoryl-undecaprenol N-acetylglucosamine transferase